MIAPNELRIGNYVYFKHCDYDKNIPRKVNYTKDPNLLGLERVLVNRIEYYNIEPIQLDEEWLLKFGLEVYTFDNGEKNQYRLDSRLIVIRDGFFTDYGTSVKLKYVHELQNLYFVLNKKELNII